MYQVWTVYENRKGALSTQFFVINKETRKIQSCWPELQAAQRTCASLNATYLKMGERS